MKPTVSIIFTAHNGESGLVASLDSIKKQTLKAIEVIMVDAASDDATAGIMKSYAGKRFSYHRCESADIEEARNLGLSLARGKYVGFCDNCVSFTRNLFKSMVECAHKEQAPLCVSRMASSDVYGRHEFTSTDLLSGRRTTDKFDLDLIWNPSVTNKLFLRQKIIDSGLSFNRFGKAQDAAFSLPFAFGCDKIACCPKGYTCYNVPVLSEGVAKAEIQNYGEAYEYIIQRATSAFENEMKSAATDFDKKELERLHRCYLDTLRHKEITVLLYCYYRHFWAVSPEDVKRYSDIIQRLCSTLSSSGKTALFKKNADIFYEGRLIDSREEMAARPRVTVCVGRCDSRGHFDSERMKTELDSIFGQTMPSFELLVDSRLSDVFAPEYRHFENVSFIEADSISDFKQKALEVSKTKYIMFLDGYVRLNPKILMRHYSALKNSDGCAFTSSPITRFDGKTTQSYKFSDLAFFEDMSDTSAMDSDAYVLDLFFCNKLFSVSRLRRMHFVFTDNTLFDMYKLYEHGRFKKLSHRGTYFPYREEEVMRFLKAEQNNLPSNCRSMFSRYKSKHFTGVTVKRGVGAVVSLLKRIKSAMIRYTGKLIISLCTLMPIKKRVFFYSIRSNGKLAENSKYVYDALDCKKVIFAKMLPHSLRNIPKIYYYMLTSRVIVTDDYIKYLRTIRLRPGQSVVQLWHAGGAFKRFGLDAPSKLSNLNEYKTHSQYTDVCVTGEYVRQFYAHAFGIDIETVKALGSPRTDVLFNAANRAALSTAITSLHPVLKNKKVIVYLPTFREIEGERVNFDPQIDWEKLDSELADDEVFIISRHPVMKDEYIKGKRYSRVKDYTSDPTVQLLAVADVIVTDYSSIIFDAALIGCPTVFYCPDFNEYERDFYLEYPKDLPGPVVYKADDLLSAVREVIENPPTEKIEAFRKKEMSACDGHSTERIAALISSYLS